MGDHFVFLVDRLLTESTLEAAIESRNQNQLASWMTNDVTPNCSSQDAAAVLTAGKMVECRICQDEDMDSNMETPCSCCGSLKVCGPLSVMLLFFQLEYIKMLLIDVLVF